MKANSQEICEEISFPSFFRKNADLRFKASYLEKMRGFPNFILWFPIALAKIYVFLVVLNPVFSRRRPWVILTANDVVTAMVDRIAGVVIATCRVTRWSCFRIHIYSFLSVYHKGMA